MDTKRIEQLAKGARTELLKETTATLYRVLTEGSAERLANPLAVSALEEEVALLGESGLIERVAYTWFNRLCALRFMDVRGYTPTGVVSPRNDATTIAILADAQQGVFSAGLGISTRTQQQVADLLSGATPSQNPSNDAYKELLKAACSHYASSMGYLFSGRGNLASAIDLLIPDDLISQDSILRRICAGLDEEACRSVEVLGWLYQFYIAERKDEVFAGFQKNKKAGAAEIAPATQLFTPDWIVRYMVENSLGRLWLLNKPDSPLRQKMQYYIENDGELEFTRISLPTEIKCLDPACGSGHILVYMFDLLYEMYEESGYQPEYIPELILRNNLTGFEIDARAAEIASFALEMKALERDPSFLGKDIDPQIIVWEKVVFQADELMQLPFLQERPQFLDALAHLDEIGSLCKPDPSEMFIVDCCRQTLSGDTIYSELLKEKIVTTISQCAALSQQYDVVVANPPYMGSKNMNNWLSEWLRKNYPDEKSDLCTCFIERGFCFAKKLGYSAMVTMQSWMFLSSHENMRNKLLRNRTILAMAHLGARAFDAISGEVVSTTVAVFENQLGNIEGTYARLVDLMSEAEKDAALMEAINNPDCGWFYRLSASDFTAIPGSPIAYWAPISKLRPLFDITLNDNGATRRGLQTGDKERFIRLWYECDNNKIEWGNILKSETRLSEATWYKFNNGGEFRKWYGNLDSVVNWKEDGREIKDTGHAIIPSEELYFRKAVSWGRLTSGDLAARCHPKGVIPGDLSPCYYSDKKNVAMGFLNSSTTRYLLDIINPTMTKTVGDVGKLPLRQPGDVVRIEQEVKSSIEISKADWDSFETSWDFQRHLLTGTSRLISEGFSAWQAEADEHFYTLKANEEELNRIFADIYGLQNEVPIEVSDDKVTVRRADLQREIRSLVSYAIGCIFGRYSLDKGGLILANQGETVSEYLAQVPSPTFRPDENNIIPVLDDEWFEDGVVFQFMKFLEAAYGADTLDENLRFIEQALGKDIRSYMVKDFYDDHIKVYKKRPIYWLFSSPKKSFNVLIYMHRYTENTVSEILSQYLRPFCNKLNVRIQSLRVTGSAKDTAEADKLQAVIEELDAWERDVIYPMAHDHIQIDLDEGVKVNYNKFPHALRKVTGLSEW